MDPVTAFGLACNVLTVLDLAVAAGKELKDLYDSSSGYTKATQPLLEATKHLTDTVQVLKDAEEQFGSAGSRDQLRGVAKECALAAESLNAIVEKCKVRKRQSVLSAAVALGRSAKSKSEIVRLQQAFEAAVDRLRMSMEAATR
jgi:NADH dehydrogenase/NADH:ubiquinone oxidoreductase subunit G